MKIKREYEKAPGSMIWDIVIAYIKKNGQFESVTGLKYSAEIRDASINYKGGTERSARATKGESISKDAFIDAFEQSRSLKCINTSKVKPIIRWQQSPFVGLLKSAGIIE